MNVQQQIDAIISRYTSSDNHRENDYFTAINQLVQSRNKELDSTALSAWQAAIDETYLRLKNELITNRSRPLTPVKFGTSGWRGILGKDLFVQSVAYVTAAIVAMYKTMESDGEIKEALGVSNFEEMQHRGCVIGFDNRFGGEILASCAMNILAANDITIHYAGEATTGSLSAAVLKRKAAFSINFTPSHNPLQYGGIKYNSADGGPAAPVLTNRITELAARFIEDDHCDLISDDIDLLRPASRIPGIQIFDALQTWQDLVRDNKALHGLDYDAVIASFATNPDLVVAIDCVHGASRKNIRDYFKGYSDDRLAILRGNQDYTFGGIAPEPSSTNMQLSISFLKSRNEPLKLGAIIDPDGDRIRFTDGETEISMNEFGAMAYHFIHEIKEKKGLVAKTVATSNLANAVADKLGEETFEPKVGFKEFKPVIGKALVFFEESDGISIIGHTPEKDAYIGLLLALDMILTLKINLGDYLKKIAQEYGAFYPDRDGVTVSQQGAELTRTLAGLDKYAPGVAVRVGDAEKIIDRVISIDGRKMLFEDGSWLMIRPSGTEPKVRFYVEGRDRDESGRLVETAKSMLAEIGLLS